MQDSAARDRYRAVDDGEPTVFTTEGMIGLFGGLLIGLAPAVGAPILAAVGGAAAGGLVGLFRSRKNFSEGKYVERGSVFNLKGIAGLLVGASIAAVLLPLTPIAGSMLAFAALTLGGGLMGAVAGKVEQNQQFDAAKRHFEIGQLTAEHEIHKQQDAAVERAQDINLPEFQDGRAGADFRKRIEAQRKANEAVLRR